MKLLYDENLSPNLVDMLSDLYPGSAHVRDAGLEGASDDEVWEHAIHNGFTIVSKNSDFNQRGFLQGPPPKVIWIRRGNCSTSDIEIMLRTHHGDLTRFSSDPNASLLALS